MLLIGSLYFPETLKELEVALTGDAVIDPPTEPSTLSNEEWRNILFVRTNIRNPHCAGWRHNHCSAPFFSAVCDADNKSFLLTHKEGQPRVDLARLTGPCPDNARHSNTSESDPNLKEN